jgi:ATP-dependent helicase HrpB
VVLTAPPGAGKTTRVPPALIERAGRAGGEVWVLEPRRLAVRLSARRVAEELGEPVGERVGYHVRFEDVASPRTRLRFVTEGVLLRRFAADPALTGIGALVFDEFHERHLQGDLALALARRLADARSPAEPLSLVVMSATLEADSIAAYLGGPAGPSPIVRSEGVRFPVAIEHAERDSDRPLELEVAAAVRRLLREGLDGDVLVFLPGAREIRRAREALSDVAAREGLEVVPLHGDLPPEAQDRAVATGTRRKVILSTNVAETSITVPGVVAVIDSGLARMAAHSPWSGVATLKVKRISRASATQRAGRAGRLRPGRCIRLYTRHDHDTRPEADPPEVRRLDLAAATLLLAELGLLQPGGGNALAWLEAPPEAALAAARGLLERLGALESDGRLTALGRRMLRLPVHPRQARVILDAEAAGVAAPGCILAALIEERDLVRERPRRAEHVADSDLLEDLERFAEAARGGLAPDRARALGLDVGAAMAVDRVHKQLLRELARATPATSNRAKVIASRPASVEAEEAALREAVLAGYPDRVARRRRAGSAELLLSTGGTAVLADSSVVRGAELMVAIDTEERGEVGQRGAVTVRVASAISPDWLLDRQSSHMREEVTYLWNTSLERIEEVRRLYYDGLVLDERRGPPSPDADADQVGQALYEAVLERGGRVIGEHLLARLRDRVAFALKACPEVALAPLDEALERRVLRQLCRGATSFAELEGVDLVGALLDALGGKARALIDELAPERIRLPGGRQVLVEYPAGQPPFIASRLQDFFGMGEGPRLARGRVPLTLHLLAPNQRAVQVTSDLAGFWERHYPAIRRELGRRYPRHAWPEDPRRAAPPQPKPRRQ